MNQTFTLVSRDGTRYEANNIILSGSQMTFLCSGTWTNLSIEQVVAIEVPRPVYPEAEKPA